MNEKLAEKLIPLVDLTTNGIQKGIEVICEQAPELIRQLITWNIAADILMILLSVIFSVAFFKLCKHGNQAEWEIEYLVFLWVFGGVIESGAVIVTIVSIFDLVKIFIAPKLWLAEYFLNLVK